MVEKKPQVLIIDDDSDMRSTLSDILQEQGYKVRGYGKGKQALDWLRKNPFDVVIVDIKLPDADGMELVEHIRLINPESAVIMMTGYASVETAIEAMKEGAYAYIVKPFNIDELNAVIKKALREIRLSLQNKQLIDKLQRANRELERNKKSLLKERALQLEAANKELESTVQKLRRSNEQLQEFIHIASHDLREPSRKVFSFGQLLLKSLKGRLNDDEQENLNFMIDGADRMQQTVKSLLVYTKVTTEEIAFEEVDLNRIIEELKSLELSINLEVTEGRILVPAPLPAIKGDSTQIRQLLQNLISNALKYHRKGVLPEVTIRAQRQYDGMVRIEVEDNGIGIKEESYNHIFAMFRRLHPKEVYDGTGVGLAICKKIVERHKGQIGVRSTYGVGSTFWFTLPTPEFLEQQQKGQVSNFEIQFGEQKNEYDKSHNCAVG